MPKLAILSPAKHLQYIIKICRFKAWSLKDTQNLLRMFNLHQISQFSHNVFFHSFIPFLFFLAAFYSTWLFGLRWPMFTGGTVHGLQHGWSDLFTCARVVRGEGGCWTRSIPLFICPPQLQPPGMWVRCGWEGKGICTQLIGLCIISAWDWVVTSWEHGLQGR